jgi:Protein of unknown function (DUF3048) N-terminal domain/Protein of unknown function (DUF3048) C-terminal domain
MASSLRRRLASNHLNAVIACVVLLVTSCASGGSGTKSSTTSSPPTPTPIPPLAAPAIVQVENSPEGRPQSGLASANIVYEYVAEGGVGRFSLIFFGPPPPSQQVGPVRSARTVTVQLAGIYQAFLAYSGASTYITGLLNNASFPSYSEDGARGNLFRVSSRYAPHNLYTDGTHLANLAAMAKLPAATYRLWKRTTTVAPGGVPVTSFTAAVSFAEQPLFTWHPELGGFTRTEATGPARDPTTGALVVLPTVIVQQVAVTTDTNVVDVNGTYGVDQQITGTGTAQVFTQGREYQATWTQPANGPPQFTLAGGAPAPIAPGEVWISLVPTGQPAAVK